MVNTRRHFARPTPGLLDRVGAPALAAFSLCERLRLAYRGPLLTVRRSSDNATLDIGAIPTTGKLNRLQLLGFCGAGNGFVTKLWDHSGSGRHLTQGTTSLQSQIVSSGALLTMGTRTPTTSFDGADDRLTRADALGLTGSPALTIASTFKLDSANRGPRGIWGLGANTASNNRVAMYANALGINPDYGGSYDAITPSVTSGVADYAVQRHAAGANVDTADVRINGVQSSRTGGAGTGALNMTDQIVMLGCSTNTADFQIMRMATWVAFNSVLSGTALSTLESGLAAQCA